MDIESLAAKGQTDKDGASNAVGRVIRLQSVRHKRSAFSALNCSLRTRNEATYPAQENVKHLEMLW